MDTGHRELKAFHEHARVGSTWSCDVGYPRHPKVTGEEGSRWTNVSEPRMMPRHFLPLNGSGILSSDRVLLARAHRPNIAELEQSGGTDVDIRWCDTVSYTHLRAHETVLDLVCRL